MVTWPMKVAMRMDVMFANDAPDPWPTRHRDTQLEASHKKPEQKRTSSPYEEGHEQLREVQHRLGVVELS